MKAPSHSRWHSRWPAARSDDGAVAILVAIFAVVIFGFAALVVDLGYAHDVKAERQQAADAAALAAAQELSAGGDEVAATHRAMDRAADNAGVRPADWASCTADLPSGWTSPATGTPCIAFSPDTGSPTQVRVTLPAKSVSTFFAGAFGKGHAVVSVDAQASIAKQCSLCIGSSTAFQHVHVDPPTAVAFGVADTNPGMDAPFPPPGPDLTTCPTAPGSYGTVTVSGDCVLPQPDPGHPGAYYFAGPFTVTGSLTAAPGTTLMFHDAGTLLVGGSLTLTSSPTSVALYIAHGDTAAFDLGTFDITGGVYAPDATWTFHAGSCNAGDCSFNGHGIYVGAADDSPTDAYVSVAAPPVTTATGPHLVAVSP